MLGCKVLGGNALDWKNFRATHTYVCMHGCVCNDPSVEAMKLKVKAKGKHKPLQHDTPESAAKGAESANAVVVRPNYPPICSHIVLLFCLTLITKKPDALPNGVSNRVSS